MKSFDYEAYGVLCNFYICDINEGLSFHEHPFPHTHTVIKGKTKVEVGSSVSELLETESIELPANVPHQLIALENKTVFLNIIKIPEKGQDGGVVLIDGS